MIVLCPSCGVEMEDQGLCHCKSHRVFNCARCGYELKEKMSEVKE